LRRIDWRKLARSWREAMGGGGHGGWRVEEEEKRRELGFPPSAPFLYPDLAARWKAGDTGLCAGRLVAVWSNRAQRRATRCKDWCSSGLYQNPILGKILM
jgi:hypothetical protein